MRLPRAIWFAAALLAACASSKPPQWVKEGASEARTRDDLQECETKAKLTMPSDPRPPPSPYASAMIVDVDRARSVNETKEFQQCMRDRGYNVAK